MIGRKAFTLIELLTVIAIIGILAAILVPTVGAVRKTARTATCTNNLRQIFFAIQHWAGEHKGYYPPLTGRTVGEDWAGGGETGGVWYQRKSPFTAYLLNGSGNANSGQFICPENLTEENVGSTTGIPLGWPYTVNYHIINDYNETNPKKRLNIGSNMPFSTLVMMADSQKGAGVWGYGFNDPTSGWSRVGEPHAGKANFLWCDGHVSRKNKAEITRENCVPSL